MTYRTTGYQIMLMLALRHRRARQAAAKVSLNAPLWMQDMLIAQLLAAKETHREAKKLYAKKS